MDKLKSSLKLDKWQEEILECKDKRILLCKGRQIGGTTIFARKCAERMISQKNCKIVVTSITEDQAQLVIAMVLGFMEEDHKKLLKKPYSRNVTKSIIHLTNGSEIISRPVGSTGNSVRGFTGDVLYLNEASRMPEFVFEAAKAILLTTGGDIWIDSTPFGCNTFFHKSFLNTKRYTVFYHTSEEVMKNRPISESWTETQRVESMQMLKEEKEDMTDLQYKQEYLGLFVGGIQRFISEMLIEKICTIKSTDIKPKGDNFQGIDIARLGGDEIVLVSGTRINRELLKQIDITIPEAQLLTDTARLIIHKDKILNHEKIFMDDGGLGVGVFDILYEDNQTKRKVIGLNNASREIERITSHGKIKIRKKTLFGLDLAINLRNLMEKEGIELFDDERIKQSFRSMQCDYSDGNLKIYGNYSHIFEAIKRMAHCMKDKSLNIYII